MTLTQSDVTSLVDAIRAGEDIDVIRKGVELVLPALIEAEATEVIGAGHYERTEARTNQRAARLSTSGARLVDHEQGLGRRGPLRPPPSRRTPQGLQGVLSKRCASPALARVMAMTSTFPLA